MIWQTLMTRMLWTTLTTQTALISTIYFRTWPKIKGMHCFLLLCRKGALHFILLMHCCVHHAQKLDALLRRLAVAQP